MSTIRFKKSFLLDSFSLIGSLEHNPSVAKEVDVCVDDYYYKSKNILEAEVMYQKKVIDGLINKSNIKKKNIDLLIGGDLNNQLLSSNICASKEDISYLGLYNACAIFVESLIIGSSFLESNLMKNIICVTSSHNLVSEREFRFPIEYGAVKHKVSTFTSTGAVSSLLTKNNGKIKIESATIGKVFDIGYDDINNIGAAMAPSCAEVIEEHLRSTNRKANYYNLILTGDLGVYGLDVMKEYLYLKYNIKLNNVKDAGVILYNSKKGDEIAGGSGPICLPLVLFNKILKTKKYKKILIVATGSLHSSLSSKLRLSIPSISHAVSLEVID